MLTTRVLVDASVLYSRTCRDWLIMAQLRGGPYTVHWTEDILAETIRNLRLDHPTWDGGAITAIRNRVAGSLEDGRVDDFVVDGTFPGRDVKDQHVHAAALACRADIVLTDDKGFSAPEMLDRLPYEVQRPDEFFVLMDNSAPDVVRRVAGEQVSYFVRRDGEADVCARLRVAGCPDFAERVRRHLQTIDLRSGAVDPLRR